MLTIKLACGNVRRSVRDFSIYFATLAFASCLLYSFLASTDYLLALDLTLDQRASFSKAGEVLQAFAVFIDVIFCFLLGYANAFLLRRRKREFGLYLIVGLEPRGVAAVLAVECTLVGTIALACGLLLGWALSPAFSLVAAFVFGATWRPALVFCSASAAQCAGSFLVISAVAAVAAARGACRCPIAELIHADRVPERRCLVGARSVRAQKVAAAVLLALVWGVCLIEPGYFVVLIVPMGFVALFGSYFLVRVLYAVVPERLRGARALLGRSHAVHGAPARGPRRERRHGHGRRVRAPGGIDVHDARGARVQRGLARRWPRAGGSCAAARGLLLRVLRRRDPRHRGCRPRPAAARPGI